MVIHIWTSSLNKIKVKIRNQLLRVYVYQRLMAAADH
jgi:hypothetical protein